jgi:transposase
VTAGQRDDSTQFEAVMEAAQFPRRPGPRRPRRIGGDKGYSASRIRLWIGRRTIDAVIPYRSGQTRQTSDEGREFDREAYRGRNVIERCVGWLKRARRIATRFDKLALCYLAMLKLAILGRYLRIAFRNTT